MPKHDFSTLYEQYPAVIAQMPAIFTSHQFILRLAQQNQVLYIEALHSYRDATHRGAVVPFMRVHNILSKRLHAHPDLVELVRGDAPSTDIFGRPNECAQWRKL
jgi:hypothetical protein